MIHPLLFARSATWPTRSQGPSEGIRAALAARQHHRTPTSIRCSGAAMSRCSSSGSLTRTSSMFYGSIPDFVTHGAVAREIAEQGIVLLKNENNFLPLKPANIKSVALIGATWYAGMAKMAPLSLNGDNANVDAPYTVTPKQGLARTPWITRFHSHGHIRQRSRHRDRLTSTRPSNWPGSPTWSS